MTNTDQMKNIQQDREKARELRDFIKLIEGSNLTPHKSICGDCLACKGFRARGANDCCCMGYFSEGISDCCVLKCPRHQLAEPEEKMKAAKRSS